MTRVWLASYPKSGSTWFRMLIASLSATEDRPLDINGLAEPQPVIGLREIVDDATLIDTSLLTHDEADDLRSCVYADALPLYDGPGPLPRFYKVHDAYLRTPAGGPLLGCGTADAAILIVRDPRDVAVSLAAHFGWSVDRAIAFMSADDAAIQGAAHDRHRQFRQRLLSWSGHAASWLDQDDLPIHVVRYESLQADTAGAFREALAFADRALGRAEAERAAARASFANLQAQERERGFSEGTQHGAFFRQGRSGGWRESLTPAQAGRIEEDHRGLMGRLGYAALQSQPPVASGPGLVASSPLPGA